MIDRRRLESGGLIVFLVAVSVGLLAIVSSFIGALLWAVLAAILFQSLFQWLLKRWPGHRNRAAAATLLVRAGQVRGSAFFPSSDASP